MIPPKPTANQIKAIRRLIPDLDYLNQVIHQTASMGLKHNFFIEFNPHQSCPSGFYRARYPSEEFSQLLSRGTWFYSRRSWFTSVRQKPKQFSDRGICLCRESRTLLKCLAKRFRYVLSINLIGQLTHVQLRAECISRVSPWPPGHCMPYLIYKWNYLKGASDYRAQMKRSCLPKMPKSANPPFLIFSAMLHGLHRDFYILRNLVRNFDKICAANSLSRIRPLLRAKGGFSRFIGLCSQEWNSKFQLSTPQRPSTSDIHQITPPNRPSISQKKANFDHSRRLEYNQLHFYPHEMSQKKRCPVCDKKGTNGCRVCQQRMCMGLCTYVWHNAISFHSIPPLYRDLQDKAIARKNMIDLAQNPSKKNLWPLSISKTEMQRWMAMRCLYQEEAAILIFRLSWFAKIFE